MVKTQYQEKLLHHSSLNIDYLRRAYIIKQMSISTFFFFHQDKRHLVHSFFLADLYALPKLFCRNIPGYKKTVNYVTATRFK